MTTGDFDSGFAEQQLAEGFTFRTGFYESNISQGDTEVLTIENPDSSPKALLIRPTKIQSSMEVVVSPSANVNVDSEGSSLPAVQLNGLSNETPVGVPRRGDTVSGGVDFPSEFVSAQKVGGQAGSGKDGMSTAAILGPGQVAAQEFTFPNGGGKISVTFNWVEVTDGLVPANQ